MPPHQLDSIYTPRARWSAWAIPERRAYLELRPEVTVEDAERAKEYFARDHSRPRTPPRPPRGGAAVLEAAGAAVLEAPDEPRQLSDKIKYARLFVARYFYENAEGELCCCDSAPMLEHEASAAASRYPRAEYRAQVGEPGSPRYSAPVNPAHGSAMVVAAGTVAEPVAPAAPTPPKGCREARLVVLPSQRREPVQVAVEE